MYKGHKAEEFVVKQLSKKHKGLRFVEGKCKEYDLIADDGYTVEVKYDILSKNTGRVGIEFECDSKPSGIETTKAIDWVHIYKLYDNWVYSIIPVANLRAFLRSNKDFLTTASGGDCSAKMYLISVHDFADHFSFFSVK